MELDLHPALPLLSSLLCRPAPTSREPLVSTAAAQQAAKACATSLNRLARWWIDVIHARKPRETLRVHHHAARWLLPAFLSLTTADIACRLWLPWSSPPSLAAQPPSSLFCSLVSRIHTHAPPSLCFVHRGSHPAVSVHHSLLVCDDSASPEPDLPPATGGGGASCRECSSSPSARRSARAPWPCTYNTKGVLWTGRVGCRNTTEFNFCFSFQIHTELPMMLARCSHHRQGAAA